jgi:hypothetical protein
MPRVRRTEKLDPEAASQYRAKGDEYLGLGERALVDGRWNGAGLAAIHSGISLADALLVDVAGVRSLETDHGTVIDLLEERVAGFGARQKQHLGGLLRMKNVVEYEKRLLTETEARQLMNHARRFARWTHETLG